MLSKRCKYAIKALLYVTRHRQHDKGIFSSEISEQEHIPHKFLEAILRDLKNNQFLISKRGRNGGYQLAKDPNDINLMEVIRVMDGPIALMPCVSLKYYQPCDSCEDEQTCSIRKVFLKVRDNTLAIFKDSTLQSMVDNEETI